MRLPDGVFDRPRQEHLIAKERWAIIWIKTKPPYSDNERYTINNRTFEQAIAPYIHGDWEVFDRLFRLNSRRKNSESGVIYSGAEHRGDPKLPNITVVPNLGTKEHRRLGRPLTVLGCTMGHYHPPSVSGHRIQEVYEFQSYGMMVLDREQGELELWVAQEGDKVAVPNSCHMTLYNLGDDEHPLITLDFANPDHNPANKELVSKCGSVLLAYYDDFQVVFTLNHLYINSTNHHAGVFLSNPPREQRDRQIRIGRGVRLELGRLLYEELTQNPDLIGQFARLGIRIKQASSEAILEPLVPGTTSRLYFSLPLVEATKRGTEVYRYFFEKAKEAKPDKRQRTSAPLIKSYASRSENQLVELTPITHPLVIVVEGVGDWVEQAYRPLFIEKREEGKKLSIFYADDTRWKKRPEWASPEKLHPWETYLDKADLEDYDKYRILLPDVVFVVTPDFTHSAVARWWLGKVPVVFIEKPFDSQIKNVDDLRAQLGEQRSTVVFGLDHYRFYAAPIEDLKEKIEEHLDGVLEKVVFYLTEKRPIEAERTRTLQYGLTLDLLPHLTALLSHFGDVGTIDNIRVLEAGQYDPLDAVSPKTGERIDISKKFYNETYSRVQFTFRDFSGTNFDVPCLAVVGKGFSKEVKYLEITGCNGNRIRIDLNRDPEKTPSSLYPDRYPWDSIFFMQSEDAPLQTNAVVRRIRDPYNGDMLAVLYDPSYDPQKGHTFCRPLKRERYNKLLESLLSHENTRVTSTLSLAEGREIVRALDRTWWAIQAARPWMQYPLGDVNPEHGPVSSMIDMQRWEMWEEEDKTTVDQNLIQPTRSHGEIPKYVAATTEPGMVERVQTRGAIPTLNASAHDKKLAVDDPLYLSELIEQLREQVGGLPLTILLHNSRSDLAEHFLKMLSSFLRKADGIWLVPLKETEDTVAPPEIRGAVLLKPTQDTDRRIYDNLIGDLVFFPASDEAEAAQVTTFEQRARAVVVNRSGSSSDTVAKAAIEASLITYLLSEEGALEKYTDAVGGRQVSKSGPPAGASEMDEIGQSLKAKAVHLEKVEDRRHKFRSQIEEAFEKYPDQPKLREHLIRQADEHQWPTWAVECFPSLYITTKTQPDGRITALVWHQILACVPKTQDYEVAAKLCNEQFLEVEIAEETAKLIGSIAQIFERNLRQNPYQSERAFSGVINQAMIEVEQKYPEGAQKSIETRKEALTKEEII